MVCSARWARTVSAGSATARVGGLAEEESNGIVDGDGVGVLDGASVVAVPLLRGERPEAQTLIGALAEVWTRGVDVDWEVLFEGSGARRVKLPTYAFQRERFWLSERSSGKRNMAAAGQSSVGHPLLSAIVEPAEGGRRLFTGRVSLRDSFVAGRPRHFG